MQILVLIERMAGNGVQARATSPFALAAEGTTREEALGKLRELIQGKLSAGSEVIPLEIPAAENPWLAIIGVQTSSATFSRSSSK